LTTSDGKFVSAVGHQEDDKWGARQAAKAPENSSTFEEVPTSRP